MRNRTYGVVRGGRGNPTAYSIVGEYMKKNIVLLAVGAGLLVGSYFFGYSNAETEGLLAIEQMKAQHQNEVAEAQAKIRGTYEKRIKELGVDLERVRVEHDQRLRELDKFKSAKRDLESCTRDRNDLAELAIRGERLLRTAESYLGR